MSRIGKQPVIIPTGVTIEKQDNRVQVNGPKGNLSIVVSKDIKIEIADQELTLSISKEDKITRSMFGMTRAKIANLVEGVTQGFTKQLKLVGTGYRVRLEGDKLVLSVGYSHPVEFTPQEGIKFEVEGNDSIKISGIDKELVGQFAAKIRAIRPPEPYKGKGIRYENEQIRRKAGKAGKAGAAAGGAS